jgi:gliding-associated putative ABC transporter substrate-binding component GldG
MDKKDFKKNFIIYVALIIVIIIAANFIFSKIFTRIDVTKNKSFTLSQVSKDIVSKLDDKLEVKAFFTTTLPPPYNNLKNEVKDLLEDYRVSSNGNFNYEVITASDESDDNNDVVKEAQKYNIAPIQVQVMDNDKYELKKALLGLAILYKGKTETIPVVQNTTALEYDITSKMKKLTDERKKKIGFLTGHSEYDITSFQKVYGVLQSQYEVIPSLSIAGKQMIPDDLDVLVILGAKAPFPEYQKFKIDQYLMRGGNLLFCDNKVIPNFQQQIAMGEPQKINMDDMMESYGVKINYDLIRDLQCALVTVQIQEGMQRQINYPYFPNISNVNRDITAFSGIQSVILPYASSIDLGAANGKDLKVEPILTTSNHSSRVSDVFILSYEQFLGMQKRFVDSAFNQPGYVVAASYYGKQKSFYAGKPIPQDTSKDAEPLIMEVKGQSDKNNRIVAIGDADFADEKSNPPEMNLLFFVNTIDYMADDIGLTQIRTKVSPEALIGDVSSGTKLFVKYFDLLLPPILVVILGLLFWRLKAVRRAKLQIKGNEPNEK